MNKIQIANLLLTRRCNLSCDYCRIIKDIPEVEEYPDMKYYRENEISSSKWIEIISRLKKNNSDIFLVIYGGEPFIYDELAEILNFCHDANVYYSVISNNTDGIQKRIESVRSKISGGIFKGFTSSVDPLIFEKKIDKVTDELKKSNLGLKRLIDMKKNNKAEDVVAEVTVTKDTLIYLYDLVKLLSDNGIYSSITVIDDQKNKYYDFSSITDNSLLITKNDFVRKEFDRIIEDKTLLVHLPELLNELYQNLPSNYMCDIYKDVHNVTIDADGSFRLCLRIRGVETHKLVLDDVIDVNGNVTREFMNKLLSDYSKYCNCCNWTCMLISKFSSDRIIKH